MQANRPTLLTLVGAAALAMVALVSPVAQGLLWTAAALLALAALLPAAWNFRVLLLFAATAMALVFSEIALRLTVGDEWATVHRLDERRLHALIPGASKLFRHRPINGGGTVAIRINEAGYRGEPLRTDEAGLRVVVYGDSFVEAQYTALEATFVQRLGQQLSRIRAQSVEVINAGVQAYGPDQIGLAMEEQLPQLHPDLVVVVLYAGNDFGDLLRNKLYRLTADGMLESLTPTVGASLRSYFDQARATPIVYKVVDRAWRRMRAALARRFRSGNTLPVEHPVERWSRERQHEFAEWMIPGDAVVSDLFGDTWDADVALTPDAVSAVYKARLMDAVLGHIASISNASDVPLLVVIVPAPIDACPDWEYAQVDPAVYPDYRRRALTDALAGIAERRGIPHVNLFEPFRERGASVYLRGADDHWNDEGQALAARIVGAYLSEAGLLDR